MMYEGGRIIVERFAEGGLVPGGYTAPKYERGWWRCKDCGCTFESWSNPPHHHCKPKPKGEQMTPNEEQAPTLAELWAELQNLKERAQQSTSLDLYDKLREDREKSWQRNLVLARYADALEEALKKISECPCCEQFTCASLAAEALEKAQAQFATEWNFRGEGPDGEESE